MKITHGEIDLSVIVCTTAETSVALRGCLGALSRTLRGIRSECIVPHDNLPFINAQLERRHAWVRFVNVGDEVRRRGLAKGSHERHHLFRAAGLAAAGGRVVAMIEDDSRPAPQWARRVLLAHRRPLAAVGGVVENRSTGLVNWASYFCDYWRYQPPVPQGSSHWITDGNAAYNRLCLEQIQSTWQRSFHEPVVHGALRRLGHAMALSPKMVIFQHRTLGLGATLRRRFAWGRSYASVRAQGWSRGRAMLYAAMCPALPLVRGGRLVAGVVRRGRHVGTLLAALPFILMLEIFWAAGECAGYSERPVRQLSMQPAEEGVC